MLHVQCQQHLFALFVSSQIRDDRSQQVFFAQMTLCAMRYDLNYRPWGVDNPGQAKCEVTWLRTNSKGISATQMILWLTVHHLC